MISQLLSCKHIQVLSRCRGKRHDTKLLGGPSQAGGTVAVSKCNVAVCITRLQTLSMSMGSPRQPSGNSSGRERGPEAP